MKVCNSIRSFFALILVMVLITPSLFAQEAYLEDIITPTEESVIEIGELENTTVITDETVPDSVTPDLVVEGEPSPEPAVIVAEPSQEEYDSIDSLDYLKEYEDLNADLETPALPDLLQYNEDLGTVEIMPGKFECEYSYSFTSSASMENLILKLYGFKRLSDSGWINGDSFSFSFPAYFSNPSQTNFPPNFTINTQEDGNITKNTIMYTGSSANLQNVMFSFSVFVSKETLAEMNESEKIPIVLGGTTVYLDKPETGAELTPPTIPPDSGRALAEVPPGNYFFKHDFTNNENLIHDAGFSIRPWLNTSNESGKVISYALDLNQFGMDYYEDIKIEEKLPPGVRIMSVENDVQIRERVALKDYPRIRYTDKEGYPIDKDGNRVPRTTHWVGNPPQYIKYLEHWYDETKPLIFNADIYAQEKGYPPHPGFIPLNHEQAPFSVYPIIKHYGSMDLTHEKPSKSTDSWEYNSVYNEPGIDLFYKEGLDANYSKQDFWDNRIKLEGDYRTGQTLSIDLGDMGYAGIIIIYHVRVVDIDLVTTENDKKIVTNEVQYYVEDRKEPYVRYVKTAVSEASGAATAVDKYFVDSKGNWITTPQKIPVEASGEYMVNYLLRFESFGSYGGAYDNIEDMEDIPRVGNKNNEDDIIEISNIKYAKGYKSDILSNENDALKAIAEDDKLIISQVSQINKGDIFYIYYTVKYKAAAGDKLYNSFEGIELRSDIDPTPPPEPNIIKYFSDYNFLPLESMDIEISANGIYTIPYLLKIECNEDYIKNDFIKEMKPIFDKPSIDENKNKVTIIEESICYAEGEYPKLKDFSYRPGKLIADVVGGNELKISQNNNIYKDNIFYIYYEVKFEAEPGSVLENEVNGKSKKIILPEPAETPTEAPPNEPNETLPEEPTEIPTETPTESPNEAPTEAPPNEPNETLPEEPTETPTDESTGSQPGGGTAEVPTNEPTETQPGGTEETPIEMPTETPSDILAATEAPTETPAETPGETQPGGTAGTSSGGQIGVSSKEPGAMLETPKPQDIKTLTNGYTVIPYEDSNEYLVINEQDIPLGVYEMPLGKAIYEIEESDILDNIVPLSNKKTNPKTYADTTIPIVMLGIFLSVLIIIYLKNTEKSK